MIEQIPLFLSGENGYHTYRIPALAVTTRGTILAFCEGRRNSASDSGDIDLLMRRSHDNGRTWEELQVVVRNGADTAGNPAPVVDPKTGTVWLLFCQNKADGPERMIIEGKAPRTVWVTRSDDDGVSWSPPQEITAAVKRPDWTWYATGPGHGVALSSGRLLVPCDHVAGVPGEEQSWHSHVVYSDDHGTTWHIGGIVPAGTNESTAVETADGRVYINCRNARRTGEHHRACAWSYDQGTTFTDFGRDSALVEPICQASLARLEHGDRCFILFSNPASLERERLTVRYSSDACVTWSPGKVLWPGPAAYSDLCVAPDGTICCLYEKGDERPYEGLALARFPLSWLMSETD